MNPIIGIYISGENKSFVSVGGSKLISIILFKPEPKETQMKTCGYIPNKDPKKKFFNLILKIVGKIFEIAKGIPPTNL